MSAQGAAGAGDAAQTTSEAGQQGEQAEPTPNPQQQEPPQPTQPQPAQEAPFGTRLGAVLEEMDLPEEVRQQVMPKPKPKPEPAPEPQAQPQEQQQQPAAPAAAAATAAAEQDHPVPDEWPESAKQRVAEEAGKRRKRTEELEAEKRKNKELEGKLAQQPPPQQQQPQQPARPVPSEVDPLADVTNEQELAAALREYDELYAWAELNHDGLPDVLLGKDQNGNEIRHDYSPEEMAKIRIKCQRILNRDIPARAAYIQAQRTVEQEARQFRPELFDPQSPVYQEAQVIVQQLPEIRRFPDYQIWIADAIAGRNARLEAAKARGNGNTQPQRPAPANPTVAAFLRPQPPIAPTPPNVRGGAPLTNANDVDVKKAKEELVEQGGNDEAMEQFIAKSRQAQQANRLGGRKPALV